MSNLLCVIVTGCVVFQSLRYGTQEAVDLHYPTACLEINGKRALGYGVDDIMGKCAGNTCVWRMYFNQAADKEEIEAAKQECLGKPDNLVPQSGRSLRPKFALNSRLGTFAAFMY